MRKRLRLTDLSAYDTDRGYRPIGLLTKSQSGGSLRFRMTSEEYATLLGKIVSNLQSLEFAIRAFLYAKADPPHVAFPTGKDLDDFVKGDQAPENAMTCYDSFGSLIDRYNNLVPAANVVDSSLLQLRNDLAHGRVSARHPSAHFRLMKFDRPTNGTARVVSSQELSETWLKKQVERTAAAVKTVAKNSEIRG